MAPRACTAATSFESRTKSGSTWKVSCSSTAARAAPGHTSRSVRADVRQPLVGEDEEDEDGERREPGREHVRDDAVRDHARRAKRCNRS